MALFKRRRETEDESEPIDLSEYLDTRSASQAEQLAATYIKIVEINRADQISAVSDNIYKGNVIIIDYSKLAGDEIAIREIMSGLKKVAKDVDGDIAGISKNMLVVTPTSIKIDREKVRF